MTERWLPHLEILFNFCETLFHIQNMEITFNHKVAEVINQCMPNAKIRFWHVVLLFSAYNINLIYLFAFLLILRTHCISYPPYLSMKSSQAYVISKLLAESCPSFLISHSFLFHLSLIKTVVDLCCGTYTGQQKVHDDEYIYRLYCCGTLKLVLETLISISKHRCA